MKSKHDLPNITISILVDFDKKIVIFDFDFKIVTALGEIYFLKWGSIYAGCTDKY